MAGDTTTTSGSRELDQTPTWAVAGVCAVIIIISLALEFGLHKLGTRFTERHKKALFDALEKIKAELMVLGFISLILTFGQYYIAKICIPLNVAQTMLPCPVRHADHRRLLLYEHRVLSDDTGSPKCKHGKVPLISTNGLHQLHILVFFLAVFHVVYSAVTVALGRLKIRGWKQWEQETESPDYEFSNDPSRFRLTHETSFVRAHISFWTRNPISFYIVHMAPGSKFNFQNYIKRSLVDDFKTIVGVSPFLWATFVIFLLLNVSGWNTLFWASLVPLVIILSVGTKLQAVLTSMALGITERHAVVQGIPLVQGSDKYFWFSRPRLVLHLLHFVLFQNAFQITYFLWLWYEFNLNSCFHDSVNLLIIRIAIGISVLLMCSYITLPLYALVAQMGSDMKKTIFDEQTSTALKKWHNAAKKKQGRGGKSPTRDRVGSPIGSASSTLHSLGATLHRFKSTGHSVHSTYEDQDISDIEADPLSLMSTTTELIVRDDNDDHSNEMITPHSGEEDREEKEFSFLKLASQK